MTRFNLPIYLINGIEYAQLRDVIDFVRKMGELNSLGLGIDTEMLAMYMTEQALERKMKGGS